MTLTDVDMSRETQLDQARNKYYKKFDFRLFRAEFDTGSGLNDTYAAGSAILPIPMSSKWPLHGLCDGRSRTYHAMTTDMAGFRGFYPYVRVSIPCGSIKPYLW